MDRDSKYCEAFRALLDDAGARPVRLPPRSPNLNAYAERFVRSTKHECINRMIFFGEHHQGLGNSLIEPEDGVGECRGDIECRERLGGMLRYYYRAAA
jgi:transposase InsO family protein